MDPHGDQRAVDRAKEETRDREAEARLIRAQDDGVTYDAQDEE